MNLDFSGPLRSRCTNAQHFNQIGPDGTESFVVVLGKCTTLDHLNLCDNLIGPDGAESLAGVLPQCSALVHLHLYYNQIGETGAESLAGVLGHCPELTRLNLSITRTFGVLTQELCRAGTSSRHCARTPASISAPAVPNFQLR
jgi:hypothetical protein